MGPGEPSGTPSLGQVSWVRLNCPKDGLFPVKGPTTRPSRPGEIPNPEWGLSRNSVSLVPEGTNGTSIFGVRWDGSTGPPFFHPRSRIGCVGQDLEETDDGGQ